MSTALKQLSRISLASATNFAKTVQVVWSDGVRADFPYCWLRDISKSARPSLVHLDVNTQPKAIECSSNSLRVMWAPFSTYSFSSEFLRDHAINHPSTDEASDESVFDQTSNADLSKPDLHLKEQLYCITKMKINESMIMGSFEWRERSQEPGTIWPHLDVVPSLCVVETLNGPADLTIVDTHRALTLLQQNYPREFKCLSNSTLEYAEGLFRAKHSICTMRKTANGPIIETAIFNNALRSSVITVDAMLKLESLHKFGKICAEQSQNITLNPGERLVINNRRVMLGAPAQKRRHVVLNLMA